MTGPYTYDPKTARYRVAAGKPGAGRFVKADQVKSVINATFDRASRATRSIGEALQRGDISLAEFQTLMRQEVKNATLFASALANGGWDNLSPADFGRVGRWLAQGPAGGQGQYAYLRRLAEQIEAGLPLDGNFLRRCEMYTHQANQFFERERSRIREIMGFDEVRNRRHARDSCTGCVEQTAKGWQPLGLYVYPGNRTCLSSCKCSSQYRNSATGEIAA